MIKPTNSEQRFESVSCPITPEHGMLHHIMNLTILPLTETVFIALPNFKISTFSKVDYTFLIHSLIHIYYIKD